MSTPARRPLACHSRPASDPVRTSVGPRLTPSNSGHAADTRLTCGRPTNTAGRLLSALAATTPVANPRAPPAPSAESAPGNAVTTPVARTARADASTTVPTGT